MEGAPLVIKIPLTACMARVQATPIKSKSNYGGSEEGSEKALKMEPGGAARFLSANNMLAFLKRNQNHLERVVTIVIPDLRARLLPAEDPRRDSAPKADLYVGPTQFQMMKNVSEFQVYNFVEDDCLFIPAAGFYWEIANDGGNGQLETTGKRFGRQVTVCLEYKLGDFYDNDWRRFVPEMQDPPTPAQLLPILKKLPSAGAGRGLKGT